MLCGFSVHAQIYRFWGEYSRSIFYKPFVMTSLKIFNDTFSYIQDNNWDGVAEISENGKISLSGDTLNLFVDDKLFSKFLLDKNDMYLSMIYPDGNFLPENIPLPKSNFYRESSYYPNGKCKYSLFILGVNRETGMPGKYKIRYHDTLENIISEVNYIDGEKNGKEFHYYYIPHKGTPYHEKPYVDMITRKLGRWKNGKKVGTWKVYDDVGDLIKVENY